MSNSVRQDGDGLLRDLELIGAALEHGLHPSGVTHAFGRIKAALTPQSRGAAEGAGDGTRLVGGIAAFEVVGDDLNSMAGFTRDEGVADIWRQGGLTVRPLFAAPPKPAPDAMRQSETKSNALLVADRIAAYFNDGPPNDGSHSDAAGSNAFELLGWAEEELRYVAAQIAAPVPPADVAEKKYKCTHCGEVSETEHDGSCGVW